MLCAFVRDHQPRGAKVASKFHFQSHALGCFFRTPRQCFDHALAGDRFWHCCGGFNSYFLHTLLFPSDFGTRRRRRLLLGVCCRTVRFINVLLSFLLFYKIFLRVFSDASNLARASALVEFGCGVWNSKVTHTFLLTLNSLFFVFRCFVLKWREVY